MAWWLWARRSQRRVYHTPFRFRRIAGWCAFRAFKYNICCFVAARNQRISVVYALVGNFLLWELFRGSIRSAYRMMCPLIEKAVKESVPWQTRYSQLDKGYYNVKQWTVFFDSMSLSLDWASWFKQCKNQTDYYQNYKIHLAVYRKRWWFGNHVFLYFSHDRSFILMPDNHII